jgi:hypothetical protein
MDDNYILDVESMSLRVEKNGLTVAAGQLLVLVFLLHNLKLLTPLGLEQFK